MKLSAQWIRDFVDLTVDNRRLAEDLTGVGIAVEGISGSGADTVFEMEIGTNRPDAMNHYGVAREAAAIYDLPLKHLSAVSSQPSAKSSHNAAFPITVEEPQLCPRFSARVIRGTKVKPSSEKIAHRLRLLDQRPISNAVDATNYVLWEMGKPTHVFDMDLLEGGKLIIRKAKNGEKLKTLDGVERTLTSDDLVVADAKRAVGLAGVMGGFDTMITGKTRNILIESAWWDPVTVRKTSRRHGIHTDASHRFERGADFESTVLSCDLVAALILESGGGELVGDVIDVVSRQIDLAPVVLRVSEVHRILGGSLETGEIFRILKKLGFTLIPEGQGDAQFRVQIPSWRLDVEREIDVIEEIARLHGYDKFGNTLPAFSGAVVELPHAAVDATLRTRALALGYNEAVSLTFISHADAELFSSASVLELENPLSGEARLMRTSMVPGMLEMLERNLNNGTQNVRLFEMGRIYEQLGGNPVEPRRMCLGATLAAVKGSLPVGEVLDVSKDEHAATAEAFRCFKGDVENLLAGFAYRELRFDRETTEYFHPGRSARALIDDRPVAWFGQIHPEVAKVTWEEIKAGAILRETGAGAVASPLRKQVLRGLRQEVFVAEIDLDRLHSVGLRQVRFRPLSAYPAVERDFSFVFPDKVEFEAMGRAVAELDIREIVEFKPVEIFRGGSIEPGHYSILLRAKLQSPEETLRDDVQIVDWCEKIIGALKRVKGVQRVGGGASAY
jgi:phenylalanyl-tRNA synthetase beta chain